MELNLRTVAGFQGPIHHISLCWMKRSMKNGNYLLIRVKRNRILNGTRITNLNLEGDFLHIHLPPSYKAGSDKLSPWQGDDDDTVVIGDEPCWIHSEFELSLWSCTVLSIKQNCNQHLFQLSIGLRTCQIPKTLPTWWRLFGSRRNIVKHFSRCPAGNVHVPRRLQATSHRLLCSSETDIFFCPTFLCLWRLICQLTVANSSCCHLVQIVPVQTEVSSSMISRLLQKRTSTLCNSLVSQPFEPTVSRLFDDLRKELPQKPHPSMTSVLTSRVKICADRLTDTPNLFGIREWLSSSLYCQSSVKIIGWKPPWINQTLLYYQNRSIKFSG